MDGQDPVLDALEDLVEALRQNSARNQIVMRRARRIRQQRAQGRPYREIAAVEERPLIVELTRQNLDALLDAGSRLRRLEARALHDEGLTMQQIADLFGVTRQRVSELLKGTNGSGAGKSQEAPASAGDA